MNNNDKTDQLRSREADPMPDKTGGKDENAIKRARMYLECKVRTETRIDNLLEFLIEKHKCNSHVKLLTSILLEIYLSQRVNPFITWRRGEKKTYINGSQAIRAQKVYRP